MTTLYEPTDIEGENLRAQRVADRQLIEHEREQADYEWFLNDARGRRIVWRLLTEAKIYSTSFTGDAEGTIFNEGRRDMGLQLLSKINEVNPEAYTKMMKEREDYERELSTIEGQ